MHLSIGDSSNSQRLFSNDLNILMNNVQTITDVQCTTVHTQINKTIEIEMIRTDACLTAFPLHQII